jgi:hypothetical protein
VTGTIGCVSWEVRQKPEVVINAGFGKARGFSAFARKVLGAVLREDEPGKPHKDGEEYAAKDDYQEHDRSSWGGVAEVMG